MTLPLLSYFSDEMTTAQLISGEASAYVGGVWVSSFAAATPISIIRPQPLIANDMQLLPDGEHVRDYLKSWSETRVFTREGDRDADRIEFDGDTYKVMQNDDRSLDGVFYGFVMRRTDPGRG
jgi:hypothetical protein